MYMTHHIFTFLLIKYLVNQYGETTTSHRMATGTNPSIPNICVLFFPCVVQKASAHVERKVLNMRHQPQNGFRGIFVVIPQHQRWYLIYVHITRNIGYFHAVIFDKKSNALAYTECPYSEVLTTQSAVS